MTLLEFLMALFVGFSVGSFVGCIIGFRVGRYKEE